MRFPLIALPLFALPLLAQPPAPQFTVVSDVQYCTGAGKPLLMDIFLPKSRIRTPSPAVLWIHGGGWERGDKNGNSGAQLLANQGFVTASLFYRLSGDSPFPADIEDCKCAIRFLRANATKYGIDPDRIGVAGASAGGHLAELVATADKSAGLEGDGSWQNVSSKVQAASAYYGASDFTVGAMQFQHHTGQVIVKLFRGTEKEKPELYRKASPIFYLSKQAPPLLLVHGEEDDLVPFDQSARMADAYRRLGLPVEFIAVENAGHDFEHVGEAPISPSVETVHQKTIDFFKHYLVSAPSTRTGGPDN
ncbi:MAG TPA: alpha/beta hydrolase [Edaphobacter sp.]|nr:alpha/beta hydrolase [Edaphobacter sp.]